MKEPKHISFDELMKNLDQFRGSAGTNFELSKDQKEFLLRCRDHNFPVIYPKMAELWQGLGWGDISTDSLRRLYLKAKGIKHR
jgi:hypothetical protein